MSHKQKLSTPLPKSKWFPLVFKGLCCIIFGIALGQYFIKPLNFAEFESSISLNLSLGIIAWLSSLLIFYIVFSFFLRSLKSSFTCSLYLSLTPCLGLLAWRILTSYQFSAQATLILLLLIVLLCSEIIKTIVKFAQLPSMQFSNFTISGSLIIVIGSILSMLCLHLLPILYLHL